MHSHHHHDHHSDSDNIDTLKLLWRRFILGSVVTFVVVVVVTALANHYTFSTASINADSDDAQYYSVGRILETDVDHQDEDELLTTQYLRVEMLSGPNTGSEQIIPNNLVNLDTNEPYPLAVGEEVVITEFTDPGGDDQFFIYESYRIPALVVIFALFTLVTYVFAGTKGLRSLLGLALSIAVLAGVIVPGIVAGFPPLLVCLIGGVLISVLSIYVSHGFNIDTSIALLAIIITLAFGTFLALSFGELTDLIGTGSEDAVQFRTTGLAAIDLYGLLLGAIVIGMLGVLDDVTTAQVATVRELRLANKKLGLAQLYLRASNVGIEHIVALVNTLVMAYAGAALPVLLLFTVSDSIPAWVTLNMEMLVEEIVRTVVGSMALVMSVPIATYLAATYYGRRK